jgi:hypothetical protein
MTESPFSIQVRSDTVWLTVKGSDFDDFWGNLVIAVGEDEAEVAIARFRARQTLADAGITGRIVAPPAAANEQPAAPAAPPAAPPAPPAPPTWTPPPAAAPPAPPAYQPPAAPPAPAAAPAAGDPDAWKANPPYCDHKLPRSPYSGTNSRGEYFVFFCGAPKTTPKDQKCKPVDAITGAEWK